MGDCQNRDLRVQFDRRLKVKFLGSRVTTDAGLLAYRELDEALSLTETGEELLSDSRLGSNKQHRLVLLLRQSIYTPPGGLRRCQRRRATGHRPSDAVRGWWQSSTGGQVRRFNQ